ncbi:MAG: GNAT family N-acetyltransferase [Hyphomicrobiales bacterium]
MQRLEPSQYDRVRPLVPSHHEAGHTAFVWAVLNGAMPGDVFADDPANPKSAIVANECDFWFALGEPRADLVARIVPELLAIIPERNASALWCTAPGWDAALAPLFPEVSRRKEFHYRPDLARVREMPLPDGLELRPMTAGLAARIRRQHLDPWVTEIYGGPEGLERRSFGWMAVDGSGDPVSMCIACGIGGPDGAVEAEIEVGTDDRYRRRDLATAVALAFIADCKERGLIPAWTCASGNEPSARLARRLGFVEFREVTGFELDRDMQLVDGKWVRPRP